MLWYGLDASPAVRLIELQNSSTNKTKADKRLLDDPNMSSTISLACPHALTHSLTVSRCLDSWHSPQTTVTSETVAVSHEAIFQAGKVRGKKKEKQNTRAHPHTYTLSSPQNVTRRGMEKRRNRQRNAHTHNTPQLRETDSAAKFRVSQPTTRERAEREGDGARKPEKNLTRNALNTSSPD